MLSKRGLPGKTAMTLYIFVTMVIGGGLIPLYFLVDRMRLTNTRWAMRNATV